MPARVALPACKRSATADAGSFVQPRLVMSTFRSLPLLALCAAVSARAQTAPTEPPPAGDEVRHLDKFVVSSGPDPKTSFDLAQGTSVLVGDELRRAVQATLGETLSSTPGVNSTYYGPGASRPVIRGLGGDRVRILGNGVGSLDASNVSPDHNAALEPLFASRIEVLRGPSTLLYGSSAVGGAVNVIDNRIPESTADSTGRGVLELRAGGAGNERAAVLSAGAAQQNFALQLNALQSSSADLDIPGVARVDPEAPANQPRDTLPSSESRAFSGSLGAAYSWKAGKAGLALSDYETVYGVPTGDDPPTTINMKQKRLDFSAEITQPFGFFRGAKARLGVGDYNHAELSGGTTVNTLFKNRALEGRLELPHIAVGDLTGTWGVQTARSDFSAEGDEVVTPPSLTQSGALFAVEELKLSSRATLQFGARLEGQSIRLGEVDPALPALPGYNARSDQLKKFGGVSTSLGAVFYPAKDWSLGVSLAYTERLPTAQELFSNGPHGGTGAYEVGTTSLGNERSLGLDVSLRRRAGAVTGSVSVFMNRFSDYIFESELPAGSIPAANNPDNLTPYRFIAKDARFYGAEGELIFHVYEHDAQHVHLTLMADTVRATETTDDEALPRTPPLRFGAKLDYEDGRWTTGVEVRRAEAQDHVAPTETTTPGYTLVNAHVSYLLTPGARGISYELFARGNNLGNAIARDHSSFLKDFAPLPGRGVLFGVRMNF
jgi:iron complex outermembrane receptor protein